MNNELIRKAVHVILGLVFCLLPAVFSRGQIIFLAFFILGVFLAVRYFGLRFRTHRVPRQSHGEIYYALGLILSAFFFLPHHVLAFQYGILILALADAAASLAGSMFGQSKIAIFNNNKTWAGTDVFFIVSFLIFLFLILFQGHGSLFVGVLITLILTLTEGFLTKGLDNLFLPLIASLLLKLMIGL